MARQVLERIEAEQVEEAIGRAIDLLARTLGRIGDLQQLTADELSEYVGEYQLNELDEQNELIGQTIIAVTLEAGQLYVAPVGDPKMPLFAIEKDHFFLRIVPAEYFFDRNEDAEVIGLTLVQRGERMNAPKLR